MKYCTRCLMPSTRPRITFNKQGVCNACQHAEAKRKSINWEERWKELKTLCDKYREKDKWDVLVPCSGGKDGSYVAWRLKHDLEMHPLCVTLLPQLPTEVGKQNLENFKKAGFDHITITPNPKIYRKLAIKGFKEQGRPKMPFVTGISTVTIKIAQLFKIPFIIYGEEGETEYSGATTQTNKRKINRRYLIDYYYSGHNPVEYLDEFTSQELQWWSLPDKLNDLFLTHWSHYENWDPVVHAKLAQEKCGLQTVESIGTFTNYSQLDDKLQDLHTYMMFVKFGFGRATSDASIEIRADRMTREKGIELVRRYDGIFPIKYLPDYLKYFKIAEGEFWGVINKHANKEILQKQLWSWKNPEPKPYILKNATYL